MKKYIIPLLLTLTLPLFSKVGSITKANILSNSLIRGDYETARILIQEEPDLLITPNTSGLLPMSLAISRQNASLVERLIQVGAPVEHPNYNKQPIEHAILLNAYSALKILLEKGANPDLNLSRGLFGVHLAILLNKKDVLNLLVQYRADLNMQSSTGLTALHMAIQQNNWGMVTLLAQNKVNPNILSNKGSTPLLLLLQDGKYPSYFIDLFKGQEKTIVNTYSNISPLIFCVQKNNSPCIDKLIEYGANINSTDNSGNTALMHAVKLENESIVSQLLKYNPNLTLKNRNKKSAFQLAQTSKNKNIIELVNSANSK